GRLRDDGVAGGERGRDLSGEDREREIPRRDAREDAAAAQRKQVRFAGRRWQHERRAEAPARLRRVIAAEVGGLAHFGDRRASRLARLARKQRNPLRALVLDALRGTIEKGRTLVGRAR